MWSFVRATALCKGMNMPAAFSWSSSPPEADRRGETIFPGRTPISPGDAKGTDTPQFSPTGGNTPRRLSVSENRCSPFHSPLKGTRNLDESPYL